MIIRTCEFLIHASKQILKRKTFIGIKRLLVSIVELLIIYAISSFIPKVNDITYFAWFINSLIVFIIAFLFITITNVILFNNDGKEVIIILKKMHKKPNN